MGELGGLANADLTDKKVKQIAKVLVFMKPNFTYNYFGQILILLFFKFMEKKGVKAYKMAILIFVKSDIRRHKGGGATGVGRPIIG